MNFVCGYCTSLEFVCAHLARLPHHRWSKNTYTGWSRNQTKDLTALSVWCPCRGSGGFIPQINTMPVHSTSNPTLGRIPNTDDLCLVLCYPNVPRAWNSYRKLVGCVYLIRKQRLHHGFEHVESEEYVYVAAGAKIIFVFLFSLFAYQAETARTIRDKKFSPLMQINK